MFLIGSIVTICSLIAAITSYMKDSLTVKKLMLEIEKLQIQLKTKESNIITPEDEQYQQLFEQLKRQQNKTWDGNLFPLFLALATVGSILSAIGFQNSTIEQTSKLMEIDAKLNQNNNQELLSAIVGGIDRQSDNQLLTVKASAYSSYLGSLDECIGLVTQLVSNPKRFNQTGRSDSPLIGADFVQLEEELERLYVKMDQDAHIIDPFLDSESASNLMRKNGSLIKQCRQLYKDLRNNDDLEMKSMVLSLSELVVARKELRDSLRQSLFEVNLSNGQEKKIRS